MEVDGCPLPEDRLYDLDESTWSVPGAAGGPWTLGLMAPLLAFAGPIRAVGFRELAGPQPRGRSVATIESFRYTGAVRLPGDGTVIAPNPAVRDRPRLLNDSPYELGWMVRWQPARAEELATRLEPAEAVRERLRARIRELRIRCFSVTPDLDLIELGTECSAVLARVDEEMARLGAGEILHLVTDDPTSPIEMVRWQDRSGHTIVEERPEGNLHHFLLRREAHPVPRRRAASDGRIG